MAENPHPPSQFAAVAGLDAKIQKQIVPGTAIEHSVSINRFSSRSSVWILGSLLFWLALVPAGLPGPHPCDDLVFVPPAIEWAHGHEMSNFLLSDLLRHWGLRTDRWFVHPPVYELLLGAWLRAFGVSAKAMLTFQAAVNCGIQLGLFAFYRRLGVHPAWALVGGLIAFCGTLSWGMRPEATAALFLIAGSFHLLARSTQSHFLSGLFCSAAGAILPQAAIYAGLLCLAAALDTLITGRTKWRHALLQIGALFAGALPILLIFHWGLHGDWALFLSDYQKHLRIGLGLDHDRGRIFAAYVQFYSFGLEWIKGVTAVCELTVCIYGALTFHALRPRLLIASVIFGVALNVLTAIPEAYRLAFLNLVLSITASAIIAWRMRNQKWPSLLAGVALTLPSLVLVAPYTIAHFLREPTNSREVREIVTSHPDQPIYCDSGVVWDVFNWAIPSNIRSRHLSIYFGRVPLPADAIVLTNEGESDPHPLHLFGRTFKSVTTNSRRYRGYDNSVQSNGSSTRK